jgi:hypothetical protein
LGSIRNQTGSRILKIFTITEQPTSTFRFQASLSAVNAASFDPVIGKAHLSILYELPTRMNLKSPPFQIIIFSVIIVLITLVGPSEATLGKNIRVVYLHGAWVWTSLVAFNAAGLVGGIAVIRAWLDRKSDTLHQWSRALGRTGLFFWLTYLPISLWAMDANWNGLFLAEPRWRVAVVFAISGTLLQLGLSFLPASWASFWNTFFILALSLVLRATDNVMHPPNPLQSDSAWRIQLFFAILTLLLLYTSWQFSRWFLSLEREETG